MADLIDFRKLMKTRKERSSYGKYDQVYRRSALEVSDHELRAIVDDIDEVTTCLVEDVEVLRRRLEELEALNREYLKILGKIVQIMVTDGSGKEDFILSRVKEAIEEIVPEGE